MSDSATNAGRTDARNTSSPASADALKRSGMTSDQVNRYYSGYMSQKQGN